MDVTSGEIEGAMDQGVSDICVSIYNYKSIYLYIYRNIYLSIHHLSIYLFIYLSIYNYKSIPLYI